MPHMEGHNERTNSACRMLSRISLLLLLLAAPVAATTVQQVAFVDLVERAELIVEGRVSRVYARYDDEGRFIWTHVEVTVADVLKGQTEADTLHLKFMGGTVGDMTLEVSAMHYPAEDEVGIYFVESANVQQMNPLVGWDQGHFKVQPGAEPIVTTANNLTVVDISDAPLTEFGISHGIAHGVQTRSGDSPDTAMTLSAFKARVDAQVNRGTPNVHDE